MWIIPKNHPLYLAYAAELLASKEDFQELLRDLDGKNQLLPVTWRSTHSKSSIWLTRWKKVYWIQRLFSRILKPSIQNHLEAQLTAYWRVFLVNHFQQQESKTETQILDTFGLTLQNTSERLDPFGASSRTFQTSLILDTNRSDEIYKSLVIALKKEYTVRKKWGLLTLEKDSSSSQSWPTPTVWEMKESLETFEARRLIQKAKKINGNGIGPDLGMAVKQWETPMARDYKSPDLEGSKSYERKAKRSSVGLNSQVKKNWGTPKAQNHKEASIHGEGSEELQMQVKMWPTAAARDYKDTPGMSTIRDNRELGRIDQLPRAVYHVGRQDRENNSTTGKNPVYSVENLNPKWVCQLMGIDFEKIFSELSEIL